MPKTLQTLFYANKPVVPLNQDRRQKGYFKMILLDAEITEVNTPPNKADLLRELIIWVPETEEHIELTCSVHDFNKEGFEEGSKISIKIEKKFDVDALAQNFFKPQWLQWLTVWLLGILLLR